jgi:signal transduction histidine kinase
VEITRVPRRPTRGDLILVAVFVCWALLEALLENEAGPAWERALVGIGYAVPLIWRRRAPVLVMLAIAAVIVVRAFTADTADEGAMPFPALLVATFSIGAYVQRLPLSIAGGAIPIVLIALLSRSPEWEGERTAVDYAILTFFVSGAWIAGYMIRRRALQVHAAEAAGGERARTAVSEERARIARELHDVVAHSVSIIALQAGAAEALVERDPASAREHIGTVRRTAHEALREMRRLLDVLREDEATLAPQPELREIGDLVADSRSAGLPVELDENGELRDVPAGISLAAYRIVQEALTNVRKHAGPVPTKVVVQNAGGQLRLEVANAAGEALVRDGVGGHGLIGMRERVRLYGGTLDAGPGPDGGFVVRATLPLEELAG